MAFNQNYIQALKEKLDIETVISRTVTLKKSGANLKGLCPFHNEKTPSFTVYTGDGHFHCFGCGVGGDVITFLRLQENLSYPEAVSLAAQMAGMPPPEDGFDDSLAKQKRDIYAANREAARFYHACLYEPKNRFALEYFYKRGLSDAIIRHFGLGYAPNDWRELLNHLKSKGFREADLVSANLVRKSEKGSCYDNFRNRVMFPIIDVKGNVIAFGGRVMDDSKPKYINTSDTPVYKKSDGVFAMNFAKNGNGGKIILVEGYMDVIALHQAGITNAIACLGTAFTDRMASMLSHHADEVYICYDNDEAGRKATQRALSVLEKTALKIKIVSMTGGKDADEIIRTLGKDRFLSMLEKSANSTEYALEQEQKKYNLFTEDGKVRFLNAAVEILAELSPLEQDIYAVRLSNLVGVNSESIKATVKTRMKGRQYIKQRQAMEKGNELIEKGMSDSNNPQRKDNIGAARAEEILLTNLMKSPEYYKKIKSMITPEDFVTDFNRRVFETTVRLIESGADIDLTFYNEDFSAHEMSSVTRIQNLKAEAANTVQECIDCINAIKKYKSNAVTDSSALSDEEYLAMIASFRDKK